MSCSASEASNALAALGLRSPRGGISGLIFRPSAVTSRVHAPLSLDRCSIGERIYSHGNDEIRRAIFHSPAQLRQFSPGGGVATGSHMYPANPLLKSELENHLIAGKPAAQQTHPDGRAFVPYVSAGNPGGSATSPQARPSPLRR
jgi:hypothetical protein